MMQTALLLLSLRKSDETTQIVRTIFRDTSERVFTRIFAALALAYWGEDEAKGFLEDVLEHGAMSSSGFEYSYARLGLCLLGGLPGDPRLHNAPNPLFPHLDDR